MAEEIDTTNMHMVGGQAGKVVIRIPARGPMTHDQALTLAAWLVSIVGDDERWEEILKAVQGS